MRFAFVALALIACSRAPSAPSPATSAPPRASTAPPPPASAALTKPLPDGCWLEVDRDAALGALADALARACAPGTRSIAKSERALEAGARLELAFTVPEPGRCVRALAVGAAELSDLELELVDASGRSVARGELEARFELVGPAGPVCLAQGKYQAIGSAKRGKGTLRLEIFAPAE